MVDYNHQDSLDSPPVSTAKTNSKEDAMVIRRYKRSDISELIQDLKEYLKGTEYKDIRFSEKRMRTILESNLQNDLFFSNIVTDEHGKIVGGLCAYLVQYVFAEEVFADEMCFYILPEYRSLKLALKMVESYKEWAIRRGAKEMRMSSTSGLHPKEYSRFLEIAGFKQKGFIYSKELM